MSSLKRFFPCRVLGDDLREFSVFVKILLLIGPLLQTSLPMTLEHCKRHHRWLKADNEVLGSWLLSTRPRFRARAGPDYVGSPIDRCKVRYAELGAQLVRLTYEKKGSICVIGPKARPLPLGIESTLVNKNYRVLEPNDLSALRSLVISLSDGLATKKSDAAFDF